MKTLQEYLNNKYSTTSEKEAVIQISTAEIQEEREKQGLTGDLLEGGELDLREYINIEEVIIDNQFLQTPLTKIDTEGLIHLKEIIWNSEPVKPVDSEEDKKLWTDLGISEETTENTAKKPVIREIKRLSEIFSTSHLSGKKINLYFANNQLTREELKEQNGMTEEKDREFNIYLQLDRQNESGNFSPNLVLWTFSQELTHTLVEKRFAPNFWQRFLLEKEAIIKWVSDNVKDDYKEISLLNKSVNGKIYFFDANLPSEVTKEQITVSNKLVDETWTTISQEVINLTNQELGKGDEQAKLWTEISLEPNSDEYILKVNFHSQNPLHESIKQLISITPLKLELESLKHEKEQLPTPENFTRLTRQKEELESYLQDYTDEETYQAIITKINQIN